MVQLSKSANPSEEIAKIVDVQSAAIYLNQHYAAQTTLTPTGDPKQFTIRVTIQNGYLDQDTEIVRKALSMFGTKVDKKTYKEESATLGKRYVSADIKGDATAKFVDKVDFSNRSQYSRVPVTTFGQLSFSTGR